MLILFFRVKYTGQMTPPGRKREDMHMHVCTGCAQQWQQQWTAAQWQPKHWGDPNPRNMLCLLLLRFLDAFLTFPYEPYDLLISSHMIFTSSFTLFIDWDLSGSLL